MFLSSSESSKALIFDGLDKLSDLDDRGRTFTILMTEQNYIPRGNENIDLFLCLDLLIETKIKTIYIKFLN